MLAFALLLAAPLAHAGPSLRVVCTPASATGRLRGLLESGGPLLPRARDAAAVVLATPEDPALAARAGLDLEGPLSFSMGNDDDHIRVRLLDPAKAEQALTALALRPTPLEGGRWSVSVEGSAPWVASVRGRDLVVSREASPPRVGPVALLSDFDQAEGCRVHGQMGDGRADLAAFLPAAPSAPMVFRTAPERTPPRVLSRTLGAPAAGTSTAPPTLVITLGVPLFELLKGLGPLPVPLPSDGLQSLDDVLRLNPGATLATWVTPDGMTFAVSIPVSRRNGRPLPARRVVRRIEAALLQREIPVFRRGPTALQIAPPGLAPLEVVVERQRVLVGSDARAVSESAQGVGQPWVSDDLEALATRSPVAVESRLRAQSSPIGSSTLRLGLSTGGDHWEVRLEGEPEDSLVRHLVFLLALGDRVLNRG